MRYDPISRRDFFGKLKMGVATMLLYGPGDVLALAEEPYIRSGFQRVPDYQQKPDLDYITRIVLPSKKLAREHLKPVMHLLQYNYHQLTKQTYQEHALQMGFNSDETQITLLANNFEIFNSAGKFIPAAGGNPNLIFIEASLSSPNAIFIIDHELVHSVYGPNELDAYAIGHRNIAHLVGKNPELLTKDNNECILMGMMTTYVDKFLPNRKENGLLHTVEYLTLLHNFKEIAHRSLDQFVLQTINQSPEFKKNNKQISQKNYHSDRARIGEDAITTFADITELYILGGNKNFPAKKILREKMNLLRSVAKKL